jgi:hypothetical protein
MKRRTLISSAMLGCVAVAPVYAVTNSASGTFNTTNQSEWSGGAATILNYTSPTYGPSFNVSPSAGGTTTSFFGGHYGAEASLHLAGSLGLNLTASLNSGSVNATVPFSSTLSAPSTVFSNVGTVTPTANIGLGAGTLAVTAPNAQASVNLLASIDASASGKICFIGCTSGGGTIVNASGSLSVLSFNSSPPASLKILGANVGLLSGSAGPVSWTVQGPENTAGTGTAGPTETINAAASTDVAHVALNVATLVGDLLGVPINGSFSIDSIASLNWSLINASGTLDNYLQQSFSLNPFVVEELDVVQTGQTDVCTELFGCGPIDIPLGYKGELTIDPTYTMDASFSNDTGLEIEPGLYLSLLSASASALGYSVSIGPAYQLSEMFPTSPVGLYSNTFDLEGWNTIQGTAFDINVLVPEPGPLTLTGLALGLLGLGFARRRRTT